MLAGSTVYLPSVKIGVCKYKMVNMRLIVITVLVRDHVSQCYLVIMYCLLN